MRGLNWGEESPEGSRRGRWSQVEVRLLEDMFGLRDIKAIARELGRSEESVRRKAETLFKIAARNDPWTGQEVERLKRYLGLNTPEVIARILGRTVAEVEREIFALGRITRDGPWTRDELQQFRRVYGTRSDEDLSVIFGRPVSSISTLAAELRLAKDKAFLRRQHGKGASRMPRWSEAELHRLMGEIHLAQGEHGDAESCFLRAIEVARGQNARLWELRAVTALARLWRDRGERQASHDLLAPIHGWFTEGFGTTDLKEASTLLEELE